ncbi:LLM class flavin-dependent oxidoreductase, partial [Acinetobacter baumannii]
ELPHDERYERAGEFVHAVRGYFGSESFTYRGKYYSASGGGLRGPLRKAPIPRICTAGASDAAKEFAAQHADYYLLLAEDPAIVA